MADTPQQVNDITKTGGIVTTTSQSVETEILEPVTKSQTHCRFVLKNEGILNHSSKLVIGLSTVGAATSFYPLSIGVNSVIKDARLSIGGKTVCSTQDFNYLQMIKSSFITQSQNLEREQYTTGRCVFNEFIYNASNACNASDDTLNSATEAKSFMLNTGLYPILDYNTAGVQDVKVQQFARITSEPTFMIDMRELFPFFFAGHMLPLTLLSEQVTIDLTFADSEDRICSASGTPELAYEIDLNELKLLQDIIHYPDEIMQSIKEKENAGDGITFTYEDYQLTKLSVTQAQARDISRNLGAAGRMVSKVYWMLNNDNLGQDVITNKYAAVAPENDGKLTTNIRLNDKFLYPINVDNPARHFHNLTQAEGAVPYLAMDEYSNWGVVNGSNGGLSASSVATIEGHDPNDLRGKFFYCANEINMNERVNSQGVFLEAKYEDVPALAGDDTYTLRAWVVVGREVQIKNGITQCYYI